VHITQGRKQRKPKQVTLTRFLGSEEVLKEVLNIALGRRAYTHERIEDIESVMFPKMLEIDGKPLDAPDKEFWGRSGWKQVTMLVPKDGVGGVAGIWHSNNAGNVCLKKLVFWVE
jgi:hypothetical protein